jgi:hypothetical protein
MSADLQHSHLKECNIMNPGKLMACVGLLAAASLSAGASRASARENPTVKRAIYRAAEASSGSLPVQSARYGGGGGWHGGGNYGGLGRGYGYHRSYYGGNGYYGRGVYSPLG